MRQTVVSVHSPPERSHSLILSDGRGWWFSQAGRSFEAHQLSDIDDGFEDSLESIRKEFLHSGPFDGVLAFSQGAALLATLCCLRSAISTVFILLTEICMIFTKKCTVLTEVTTQMERLLSSVAGHFRKDRQKTKKCLP